MLTGKAVLLFSGGMDSVMSYYFLKKQFKEVVCLYVDYHGEYCDQEIKNLENLGIKFVFDASVFLNLSHIEEDNGYIPNRNLFLITVAANHADYIFIGGLADDNVGDKTPEFCSSISRTLSLSLGRHIYVGSLFFEYEKAEVISKFIRMMVIENKMDVHDVVRLLLKTKSCYDNDSNYCGKCASCYRKFCALYMNHIPIKFNNLDMMHDYMERIDQYKHTPIRQLSIRMSYSKADHKFHNPIDTFIIDKTFYPEVLINDEEGTFRHFF